MFVLGMVAGPRRELNIAQLLQLAPHSGLVERHRKFLMQPQDQVDQPPANDAMDRRDRAALNRFNDRPALAVIEPRPGAGSVNVKMPIRTIGRASCRERGCQYVVLTGVAASSK